MPTQLTLKPQKLKFRHAHPMYSPDGEKIAQFLLFNILAKEWILSSISSRGYSLYQLVLTANEIKSGQVVIIILRKRRN